MSHNPPRLLNEIDTFRPGGTDVNVIIETPKGSRNKLDYEPDRGVFELAAVLPEGSVFPYDFGFLPSTLAEDGDPLDVLVLLDESVSVGCLVAARLIGVIEAEQTEKDGEKTRNDRLLAVATRAHTHADLHTLNDLRPRMVDEIEHFFHSYNQMRGKVFAPLGRGGPDKALQIVQAGMNRLKSQSKT